MKFAALVTLCISMVVLVTANDLAAGERQDGDVLVATRRLYRPPVPGKPMVARSGFNTDGEITAVNAVNAPGSDADVQIVKGGPGEGSVVLTAISSPGMGLDVQVDIYATKPSGVSTDAPASA